MVVAHPYRVKLIAASFVKTDKRDTLALAPLLAASLIPTVRALLLHVQELRALVAHRKRRMASVTRGAACLFTSLL
ncbi:MAG: hypothetical protein H8D78_22805 [Chloroflexi bacterium]|nr:hypothetical protein [Chloroflexota bacterium]